MSKEIGTETRTEKLRKGLLDIEWSLYIETDTPSVCLIDEILRVCAKAGLEFVEEDAKMPSVRTTHHPNSCSIPASLDYQTGQRRAQRDIKDAGWKKTEGVTIQ